MCIRLRPLVLAAAAMMAVYPGGSYASTGLPGTERPLVVKPAQQYDPAASGLLVSFTDTSAGNADIWYWDAITGGVHPVATGPGNQIRSAIWGDSIVYADDSAGFGDIKLFRVLSGTTSNVTATPSVNEQDPTVSYRLIGWVTTTGPTFDVHVRDRSSGTETVLGGAGDQLQPRASGPRLAYNDDGRVKVYNANTGISTLVYPGPADAPSIDGSHVAFTRLALGGTDITDISVYDVSGTHLADLNLAGDQGGAHISGDWVSFEDYSTGVAHVGIWHWTTGDVFYPAPTTSSQPLNDISLNRVVYPDDRNGNLDLYAYESLAFLMK